MSSVLFVLLIVVLGWLNYRTSPACRWCGGRHHGRCIYNPRAGRIFANVNDDHFNYENPND